jgi:hypothetical protein
MEFEQAAYLDTASHMSSTEHVMMRERLLGEEGGIKMNLAAVVVAAAVVAGAVSYIKGWNPFESIKPHADAHLVLGAELERVYLPASMDILTADGTARASAVANFSFGPLGGSVVGCANRSFSADFIFHSLKNETNNTATLQSNNTDKNYRLSVVDDGNGKQHLRIIAALNAFQVKDSNPTDVNDPSCQTYSTGIIDFAGLMKTDMSSGFQKHLNATADMVGIQTCPPQIIEQGLLPIALGKTVQVELQGLIPVVTDEINLLYPDQPDIAKKVTAGLTDLTRSTPEVLFVEDPSKVDAKTAQDLGASSLSFATAPDFNKNDVANDMGINAAAFNPEDLTVNVDKSCKAVKAATNIDDIIAAAKQQQDAYNAKYHGALAGGNS